MTFLTTLTLMEKIRVFEAFAGYGSQSIALKRLGIDFEVVGISEIDKEYFDEQEKRFRRECFGEIKTSEGIIVQQNLF